jgi:YHS domain-containing protein
MRENRNTVPTIYNISMPNINTEYSFKIPENTIAFMIAFRDADAKYSYTSGGSSTNYITLYTGQNYYEESVNLDGKTFYFQSPKVTTAEILIWKAI